MQFTVTDGKIVTIDAFVDPERPGLLDVAVFDDECR